MSGKGSTQRPEAIPGSYATNYGRIFNPESGNAFSAESKTIAYNKGMAEARAMFNAMFDGMDADSAKEGAPE